MSRRKERLLEHSEGEGRLLLDGNRPIKVRYFLDTWAETIATGSGTSAEMQRMDGFLWWEGSPLSNASQILETSSGRRHQVSLRELRANRAHFFCLS